MAKNKVTKNAKPAKKPARPATKADEAIRLLTARFNQMTGVVEQLAQREFYARVGAAGAREKVAAVAAQDRFVKAPTVGGSKCSSAASGNHCPPASKSLSGRQAAGATRA